MVEDSEIKPKQGCFSSFWLSNEYIFIPFCEYHAPGTSTKAEQLWRGRHGRNSPAAPRARPAQTFSLLHAMRSDVPETILEFWEQIQGVSQITLQTQNAISPEIMLVFPQKLYCITGRSYLTTYYTANQIDRREPAHGQQTFCEVSDGGTHDCFRDFLSFTGQILLCGLDQASFSSTDHIV